jgi:hypothetical protein
VREKIVPEFFIWTAAFCRRFFSFGYSLARRFFVEERSRQKKEEKAKPKRRQNAAVQSKTTSPFHPRSTRRRYSIFG